jgi:Kef-type K+ transport system membrane component KefB
VTASFFRADGVAAFVGLSPIVGAFSVGMVVASTRVVKQVYEYADKLLIIFGPLFFAILGAHVDLRGINLNVLYLSGIVVAIAIVTRVVGCGLPSIIFLKDKIKAFRVEIRMISRGEVELIVAGVDVSTGVLSSDIYTTVITIITPIWLKRSYTKDMGMMP